MHEHFATPKSFFFVLKNKRLLSAGSVQSQRSNPMAYNTTASLDKLTCCDYPTICTFETVKTCLDQHLGPKMTKATWIKNLKYSRKTTETSLGPKHYIGRFRFHPIYAIEE